RPSAGACPSPAVRAAETERRRSPYPETVTYRSGTMKFLIRAAGVSVLTLVFGVLGGTATASRPSWPDGGPPLPRPLAATPVGHFRHWKGTPSDIAGGIAYSRGEVIVTDNPYDDHGADTVFNTDPSEYAVGAGQG